MLEVVEHEQERMIGNVLGQRPLGADGLFCRREHEPRIVEWRKGHPKDALLEPVGGGSGGLQCEPRLADAARSSERHQARRVCGQQRGDLGQLMLAAQERRRRHGKIRPVEALQRRVLELAELVDPLRRGQILEAMLAEIVQALDADEAGRRGRDERLSAVTARRDPCGAVYVGADVPLGGKQRRAAVNSDANPDRPTGQASDRLGCRGDSAGGSGKRDEERVALRVDLDSAVRREGGAQHDAVLG